MGLYCLCNIKIFYINIMEDIRQKLNLKQEKYLLICDSFGNTIIIGLIDADEGKIFFCNHEQGEKKEYIAASFKDFIKRCKSEKISEASRRSIKEREAALIAKGRGHIITDDLRQMWQAEIDKYQSMVQEEVIVD